MCAIIDINVIHELWDHSGTPAGQGFRLAVERGNVPIVIGGTTLEEELGNADNRMRIWLQQLALKGQLIQIADINAKVDSKTNQLKLAIGVNACQSNDHHIIALAIISGARLLYTKDQKLHRDFRNDMLISHPRGKVYSTNKDSDFSKSKKRLLNQRDLCKR